MAAYIYNITPFDATEDYEISFVYTGGNQAYYNEIEITDSETSATVYTHREQTLQHKHMIPANTLQNGKEYIVVITIYDVGNDVCSVSQPSFFFCLSKPTFKILNISENQTIKNSSCIAKLSYYQPEGEKLQSYSFLLYGENKNLLSSSNLMFDTDNMTYTFDGLNDDTQYYIRGTGKTINGITVDTGYVLFNVDYVVPDNWCVLSLTNIPDKGTIQIKTNIITVDGYTTNLIPHFIDNKYLDLSRQGDEAIFDNSFSMGSNWTLIGSMLKCQNYSYILIMSDGTDELKLQYRMDRLEGIGRVAYVQLTNENTIGKYVACSNYINIPNENDIIVFCIRKQGMLYDLELKNIGGGA